MSAQSSRDVGSGDKTNRSSGTVDEDANPPLTDPEAADVDSGDETIPPQDTGAAVPPYEGRQQSAR